MKQTLKKTFSFLFFNNLFQIEPFFGWITKGIISPAKVHKKVFNKTVLRFNIASTETYKFMKKFWISTREKYTRELIIKHMNDGDIFLNIGAHIGTFVVFANKLKKLKHTICIEASSSNVGQLLININLNSLRNIKVFHSAAGNVDKFVEFSYENLNPGYYNGRVLDLHYLKRQKNPIQGAEFIQMKKIDNIFKENKLPFPSFLLMDVDGHENLALEGMKNILKNKSLKFAIIETTKQTDVAVIKFMKKVGFTLSKEINNNEEVNNRFFKKI